MTLQFYVQKGRDLAAYLKEIFRSILEFENYI